MPRSHDPLIEVEQVKSKKGLLLQLKKDNVIGRRNAVLALTPYHADVKVIKALKRSAFHEDAWFVRKAAFSVLTDYLNSKEWIRAYNREVHSQPRRTIVTQFSKAFPDGAAKLIRESIKSDDSYIVQAEMIRQLGGIGHPSDILLIQSYVQPWSPRKIVRNAANQAVTSLKDK